MSFVRDHILAIHIQKWDKYNKLTNSIDWKYLANYKLQYK